MMSRVVVMTSRPAAAANTPRQKRALNLARPFLTTHPTVVTCDSSQDEPAGYLG